MKVGGELVKIEIAFGHEGAVLLECAKMEGAGQNGARLGKTALTLELISPKFTAALRQLILRIPLQPENRTRLAA